MTEDVTIKDVLWELLKHKLNFTSTIDKDTADDCIVSNYLADEIPKEIKIKENIRFRVFDVSDINWEGAEKDIFSTLNWNDLKTGEVNEMENIFRSLISMSSQAEALKWLNTLYLKYNSNILFMCTLFHTLSHMEYEEVFPQGPTMAMASLGHKDDRVVGYAIKAFANWNSKASICYMENNEPNMLWAKREWNRVLEYIKDFGDEADELLDENDWTNERMDTRTA